MKNYANSLLLCGSAVTVLTLLVNGPMSGFVIYWLGVGGRSASAILRLCLARRGMRQRLKEISVETGSLMLPQLCPSTLRKIQDPEGIDELAFEEYKKAMRELFLYGLESRYLQAGAGRTKLASKLIGGLLIESTRTARDDAKTRLTDWRYIAVNLPHKLGEVIFVLHYYLRGQRETQGLIDNHVLIGLDPANDDYFVRGMMSAWAAVRRESNRNCRAARRVLSTLSEADCVKSIETIDTKLACETVEDSARFFTTLQMMKEVEDLAPLMQSIGIDFSLMDERQQKSSQPTLRVSMTKEAIESTQFEESFAMGEDEASGVDDDLDEVLLSHRKV